MTRERSPVSARWAALAWAGLMTALMELGGQAAVLPPAPAAGQGGLALAAGLDGPLTLAWPSLRLASGENRPDRVDITGATNVALHYPNGAEGAATIQGGTVSFRFTKLPADVKGLTWRMPVPLQAAGRLKWSLDGGAPADLPASAGKEPLVGKGVARRFALLGAEGAGFAIHVPHGWQQLTDLRVWKTGSFEWMYTTDMPWAGDGEAYLALHVTAPDAKAPAPAVAPVAVRRPPPAAREKAKARTGIFLDGKGLHLVRHALAAYQLGLPKLEGQAPRSASIAAGGQQATLQYANGADCRITLGEGGEFALAFSKLPAASCAVRMDMQIEFEHVHGGRYDTGEGPRVFPAEVVKGHLFAGAAPRFDLTHPRGGSYGLTLPPGTYLQLDDCRQWNDWHVFQCFFQMRVAAGSPVLKLQVRDLGGAPDAGQPLVDEFGQSTLTDWPGKVKSEAELKADVEAEKAYFAGFEPLPTDEYGGLADSGAKLGLKATGFFHVEKKGGRWYLVNPAGNAFFHLGLCSFAPNTYTFIEGRHEAYAWLPPTGGPFETAYNPNSYWHDTAFSFHLANQIRKYGEPFDPDRFATRMIERVRRLGFNSSGAFSGEPTRAQREARFPHILMIGGDEIPGLQRVWDPFDEKTRRKITAEFERAGAARAADPLLIGYFLANEPLFEEVPRVVPSLKGKVAAKRALVDQLRQGYATIEAFNQAWETKADSFDALNDLALTPRTRAASADMDRYHELFLETFFRFCHDTIRKHDPNHLIIGVRLQPGSAGNEKVCRIAGKYLDVFSLNYYTYGFDDDYLARIQQRTGGLPMMFTEFFFDSPADSGMGGGFKEVASQEHRGLAYRHYVEHAAALPFVVGIEWYVLTDNPVTGIWWGRENGIRDNNGIFSVTDRPWRPLAGAMASANRRVYDLMSGREKPFVFDDPRFAGGGAPVRRSFGIARSSGPLQIDGTAGGFPGLPPEQISGRRLVEGKDAGDLAASFRVCWDDTHLHLLVDVTDSTPMRNTRSGAALGSGDAVELFVGSEEPDRPGALLPTDRRLLLGAGQVEGGGRWHLGGAPQRTQIAMTVVPRAAGDGYVLEASIPFDALGFAPAVNRILLFDVAIDDSADGESRTRQLMWSGTAGHAGDRAAWGRAKLVP